MDYTDDACMNLYTDGQKTRMRALFDTGGFRASLLSSGGCGAPNPPTCSDGIQNGQETGVDCGGPTCDPCAGCTGTEVTLSITLDNYPEETSWEIEDSNGNVVASGGTYGSSPDGSTISVTECLADGCYDFIIYDAYGDGICCGYGNGSYSLTGGGSTLASGGSFGSSESTNFCLGGGGSSCTDGILNGQETGVDCGGPTCPACPTCSDGIQNGSETGIDCGGPVCAPCNTGGCTDQDINFNNFDSSWGIWNDGGSDCRRSANDATYAYSSPRPVRLRDNTSSSTMTTDNLNLANFEEVTIEFTYLGVSMESGEDFWLQASVDGGASYQTLVAWASGSDFTNNVREFETVVITGGFTSTTKFRFRCDASANGDRVYIDDVDITGCINGSNKLIDETDLSIHTNKDVITQIIDVNCFPNPAFDYVNIDIESVETGESNVAMINTQGKVIDRKIIQTQKGLTRTSFDLNEVPAGIYFILINNNGQQMTKKFIVVK